MFTVKEAVQFAESSRWNICCAIFGGYLAVLAIIDIRKRKLNLLILTAGFLFIPAGVLCGGRTPVVYLAAGAAVGVIFLGVSRVTKQAFGYGDSILIIIIGGFLGFWDILSLLGGAFTLAAVFSLILLIKSRFHRKDSFPFVPFLAAAYIGGMAVGIY